MRLPPRGSAQDELLFIVHERQREAKFTEVAVLSALLSENSSLREKLLQVYREELFEDAYHPAILRSRLDAIRKKKQENVDQEALLKKVGTLSTPAPAKDSTVRRR